MNIMNLSTTAKDVLRVATTAGLSKDVIDLLTAKITLLDEQLVEASMSLEQARIKIAELIAENKELRKKLNDSAKVEDGLEEEESQILQFFFEMQDTSCERASVALRIPLPTVTHYVKTLIKRGFLRHGKSSLGGYCEAQYKITLNGSSHIMKKG